MINSQAESPNEQRAVLVILGSTRSRRLCPKIGEWVIRIARENSSLIYEIVDLADWRLPSDDEPRIPASGCYSQEHTRAWSHKVSKTGGFVFVTPQYNWGYPAPLKNAIDHLYEEWRGKPLLIITYGAHGGGKCAVQLRQVADGLQMRTLAAMPQLILTHEMIEEGSIEPNVDFASYVEDVHRGIAELVVEMKADAPDGRILQNSKSPPNT